MHFAVEGIHRVFNRENLTVSLHNVLLRCIHHCVSYSLPPSLTHNHSVHIQLQIHTHYHVHQMCTHTHTSEHVQPLRDHTDIMPGSPKAEPKSEQDILHRQLDIILALANSGTPLNLPDHCGVTASTKACFKVESKSFVEGAMLLGKDFD